MPIIGASEIEGLLNRMAVGVDLFAESDDGPTYETLADAHKAGKQLKVLLDAGKMFPSVSVELTNFIESTYRGFFSDPLLYTASAALSIANIHSEIGPELS